MADVIARLKVDSKEYDSKIQRATSGLLAFEKQCQSAGKSMADASKEEVEFAKSLGQMDTVASSATGKLGELKKAFTELSIQYQNLTKEEKQSPYGKALAGSLEQLKGRIKGLEGNLKGVSKELGGGGLSGALQTLGSKIGIPAGAFTALGGAVAGAAAALKVAKDAFLQTEGGMDAWGAACESAKASYTVFLNTLNNGNWSNFFTNLRDAITGANKLYDAMDRLTSIKQNNAAAIAKEQATIQELRLRQEKGENVAKELAAAEERLKNLQMQSVEQGKVAGAEQMKQTITNSVNSIKGNGGFLRKDTTAKVTEADIDAAIKDILENGQAAMDKYTEQYSKLTEKATKTVTETRYSQGGQAYQVTTTSFDINSLSAEEQALYKLSKAITDSEGNLAAGIQTYTQALQEGAAANREARKTETAVKKEEKAAKVKVEPELPEGSIAKLQDELNKAQKKFNLAGTDEERAAAKKDIDEITSSIAKLNGQTKETAKEGSIAYMRQKLQELNKEWENAADDDSRAILKTQIDEVAAALGNMEGKNKQATSALSMWGDHQSKIQETQTLLAQFYTMMDDPNIGEGQRKWAEEMAKSYEEQLKKMMGDTDQAVATMQDSLNNLSAGVGAISTLGNAFNDLKGIGEDLASAFSGEMDAWDALMTVFNSGISIMQTVIGVMEAINTLTEVSSALKKANTIATETEAATSVSAAATEAGAESTKAGANMLTAGTAAAASSAEAGESVAGIPFVGPILAVAAIAAVLAATFAAISKAKSSAKGFASGGIVGGSSYSGDNIVARLNSGEGVLTQQGVQNAAAMANSSNPLQNIQLSTEISGTNLRIVMNNDNRSKGGSRGYYANIH